MIFPSTYRSIMQMIDTLPLGRQYGTNIIHLYEN